MRADNKDFLWIILSITALLLFLNILFRGNFQAQRGARNLEYGLKETDEPKALVNDAPDDEPNLSLELLGTIVGRTSLAFIRNIDTNSQGMFRENDSVAGYKIERIGSGKIILSKNDLVRELLLKAYNPHDKKEDEAFIAYTDVSGTKVLNRAGIAKELLKANELLGKIRILPVKDFVSDEVKGFRVIYIPAGSIIEEAGVRIGDIICSVEGREIKSLQDGWEAYKEVKKQSHFNVVLLRDNKPMTLRYEIRN